MADKVFWQGVAIMIGCIIGGGILALPYAVARSGFWSSILLIVALGCIMLFLNLRIGEICVATKKYHQLVGLVERFLGKKGKLIMTAAMLLLSYGALIAYAIGSAKILSLIGGSELIWRIIFYVIGVFIVAKGIKAIGSSELLLGLIKLAIISVMVILVGSEGINTSVFSGFTFNGIGMVFGITLFAYLGFVTIPEVFELTKEKLKLKKIIIAGSLIPIIIYILFVAIVIAKTGKLTTEVATIGLQKVFSPVAGMLLNIFALLALSTAFLAVAYSIFDMFKRDFLVENKTSFLLAFAPPLIGMFFLESFARTIDIAGAVAGSAMAVLMILAHRAACRKFKNLVKVPFFIDVLIMAVFIAGVVFAVV